MEQFYSKLGERIKELRMKKEWSQRDLARIVQVTDPQITMLENGRRRLMLHDVKKYADALGISPEKLLRGLWD